MKLFFLIGLVSLVQAQTFFDDTTTTATTLCNMDPCQTNWGQTSIACSFTQNVSMLCTEGDIFTFNIDNVLKKHNELRQIIASGGLSPYDTAERMAEMQYSEELAQLALYNVKKCKFEHDECRSTNTFPIAGQNIAISWPWPFAGTDIDSKISGFIDSWFNEYKVCNMGEINNLVNLMDCGHFTQVVQEKSTHVGCAAGTFLFNGNMVLYFACNYGYGNLSPSYTSGPPGSKCTIKSSNYSALCSTY